MKEKNKRMKKTDTTDDLKIVFESNRKKFCWQVEG